MKNKQEANWFWELTTKWWFFPLFWFFLIFLYGIIFDSYTLFYYGIDIPWIIWNFFGSFFSMPFGIVYWLSLPIYLLSLGKFDIINLFGLYGIFILLLVMSIVYVYFIVSIFKIVRSKNKENKIFKKQILILFLLILLAFAGLILRKIFPIYHPIFGP